MYDVGTWDYLSDNTMEVEVGQTKTCQNQLFFKSTFIIYKTSFSLLNIGLVSTSDCSSYCKWNFNSHSFFLLHSLPIYCHFWWIFNIYSQESEYRFCTFHFFVSLNAWQFFLHPLLPLYIYLHRCLAPSGIETTNDPFQSQMFHAFKSFVQLKISKQQTSFRAFGQFQCLDGKLKCFEVYQMYSVFRI